jgi:hypothetical protein
MKKVSLFYADNCLTGIRTQLGPKPGTIKIMGNTRGVERSLELSDAEFVTEVELNASTGDGKSGPEGGCIEYLKLVTNNARSIAVGAAPGVAVIKPRRDAYVFGFRGYGGGMMQHNKGVGRLLTLLLQPAQCTQSYSPSTYLYEFHPSICLFVFFTLYLPGSCKNSIGQLQIIYAVEDCGKLGLASSGATLPVQLQAAYETSSGAGMAEGEQPVVAMVRRQILAVTATAGHVVLYTCCITTSALANAGFAMLMFLMLTLCCAAPHS